jgi:hypothetical protein
LYRFWQTKDVGQSVSVHDWLKQLTSTGEEGSSGMIVGAGRSVLRAPANFGQPIQDERSIELDAAFAKIGLVARTPPVGELAMSAQSANIVLPSDGQAAVEDAKAAPGMARTLPAAHTAPWWEVDAPAITAQLPTVFRKPPQKSLWDSLSGELATHLAQHQAVGLAIAAENTIAPTASAAPLSEAGYVTALHDTHAATKRLHLRA